MFRRSKLAFFKACFEQVIRTQFEKMLLSSQLADMTKRAEQAECQLAGCGAAALGYIDPAAQKGDWGWSHAYEDTLELRRRIDAVRNVLLGYADSSFGLVANDIPSEADAIRRLIEERIAWKKHIEEARSRVQETTES